MKLISWLAGALTALVLVLFAVSNRAPVSLRLEPFPFALELPLYGGVFASLVLGFVLGGIGAWIAGRRTRRRARLAEAEARRLKEELAEARRSAPPPPPAPSGAAPGASPSATLPALPRAG